MPVVSYASISDSPPMVAVSCRKGGYTCNIALKASSFSLCILGNEHADAIARLGSSSGSKVRDKLADAGLRHRKGPVLKVPLIEGAMATLECSLRTKKALGDHLLLFGEVRAAEATASFTDFWDFAKYRPLLYTGWRDGLTTYFRD